MEALSLSLEMLYKSFEKQNFAWETWKVIRFDTFFQTSSSHDLDGLWVTGYTSTLKQTKQNQNK